MLPRQNGSSSDSPMNYEQEVIFKCAIKGTLGGLAEKLTAEDFDELLNASQDWRKHLVIESITEVATIHACLLYTSPSPRDRQKSRMPSSA